MIAESNRLKIAEEIPVTLIFKHQDVQEPIVEPGVLASLEPRLGAGLADRLTVLLPWGSLLRAAAGRDETALRALRALCKPCAEVRVLFGYGPQTDAAAMRDLALPALDAAETIPALEQAYRASGFIVTARGVDADAVRSLPTTWAKRLEIGRAHV